MTFGFNPSMASRSGKIDSMRQSLIYLDSRHSVLVKFDNSVSISPTFDSSHSQSIAGLSIPLRKKEKSRAISAQPENKQSLEHGLLAGISQKDKHLRQPRAE
jgi:hypothetical protein